MKKQFLECGKILGAHGVRGLVKVECWCDSPKVLAAQKRVFFAEKDGSYKEAKITSATQSNPLILGIDTIPHREAAQALRGVIIYLAREDIPVPKGSYLLVDVIGLPMIDVDTGKVYGEVIDITDAPRSRIFTVKTENAEVLVPDVKEFIKEIDISRGVFIKPIPGFFE
jgi:16S rRNA processing protein RimM